MVELPLATVLVVAVVLAQLAATQTAVIMAVMAVTELRLR
jgi:hypothetical protein